ncbi:uncharacterized protein LOC108052562 [Drosophila rhopaloa]|uniref:Uncharacterized protein LOC108052562 isoform X1 n=2 Tax=Drosophila rhopaloa TaxID=1041015 RepID=A0A6P4FKU8_DRORH|nr:uncharacterized protein LOC108052562 [Drosophila rhopaloa]
MTDTDYVPQKQSEEEVFSDIYLSLLSRHVHRYPENGTHRMWVLPRIMIVFSSGDLDTITDIITSNMVHPIGSGLVASVLVEESIRDEMIRKIRANLKPMDERIQRHPNYLKSVKFIDRMKCSTIHIEEFEETDMKKRYGVRMKGSPIIVLDFPQYFFGDKPSAVITLSTFRNLSEVVKLYNREGLNFDSVSVWSAKLAQCFDLVTRLPQASQWTFNCINESITIPALPVPPITGVSIVQQVHFEVHVIGDKVKTIAFPINHHEN